jgi:hypothetical protein
MGGPMGPRPGGPMMMGYMGGGPMMGGPMIRGPMMGGPMMGGPGPMNPWGGPRGPHPPGPSVTPYGMAPPPPRPSMAAAPMPTPSAPTPPASRPLFPAAAAPGPSSAASMAVGADFRPLGGGGGGSSGPGLFPAYNASSGSSTSTNGDSNKKPAMIATASGTRLIHPEEDISLEERRLKLAKYQKRPQAGVGFGPPLVASSGYGAPPVMYQSAPMLSRPPMMMQPPRRY